MAAMKKEERRNSEDRKFAQLAPETIHHLSESIGIANLNQSISRSLSEDASYRTRELAHICSQFMRHGRRRKLTAEDVTRAMKWYDAQPVYGYGGERDVSFQHVPELDVYAMEDNTVDLPSIALDHAPLDLNPEPHLTASWLSIEGTFVHDGEEGKASEILQQNNLSPALTQYYTSTTSAILGDSEEIVKIILEDIATNSKISPLLPFFVSFVRTGMQKHSDNKVLIPRLLYFLHALFANCHLNFSPKPYLSHLVTALLSSIIPDRPGKSEGGKMNNGNEGGDNFQTTEQLLIDHVHLASHILSQVLERWATPVNQLRAQTHRALRDCLRDGKMSSYTSHYGALYAMITMGPDVLEDCLLPEVDSYATSLLARLATSGVADEGVMANGRYTQSKKKVMNTILGTLTTAVRCILDHRCQQQQTDQRLNFFPAYSLLSECFGDALCIAPLPESGCRRRTLPAKEIVGRLRIRRLFDKGMNGTTPIKGKEGSSLQPPPPQSSVGYSKQDFDSLADLGVPNDIFDEPAMMMELGNSPERQQQQNRYTRLLQATTPKKLSATVRREFDTSQERTVNRYKPLGLTIGGGLEQWKRERLKRNVFQTPMRPFDPTQQKTSLRPCIGKRMSYPRTTERFKLQRLYSCSIRTTL